MTKRFSNTILHSLQPRMPLGSGSTSLLTLGKNQFYLNFGHFGGLRSGHLCCGFILCFPDDQRCGASFHMLINHLNFLPSSAFWRLSTTLKHWFACHYPVDL